MFTTSSYNVLILTYISFFNVKKICSIFSMVKGIVILLSQNLKERLNIQAKLKIVHFLLCLASYNIKNLLDEIVMNIL